MILVGLAIAATITAALLAAVGYHSGNAELARPATWMVGLGVVAVVVTTLALPRGRSSHPKRQGSPVARVLQPAALPTTTTAPPPTAPLSGDVWQLPAPSAYLGLVGVGFPHTTAGALALGFEGITARINTDPDLTVSVVRTIALSTTPALLSKVAEGTKELRVGLGLTPDGPTPDILSLSLDACQVEQAAPDRVVAGFEGTLVAEGPGIAGSSSPFSVAAVFVWSGTDWRMDTTAEPAQPAIAFPGDPKAAGLGWHPCVEG